MTAVWDHSKARGAQLLLLLAIADNAGDEGLAWPGLEELAKRARVKKRAVIDQIEKLEKTGELRVLRRTGKHNYYVVDVGLTDADRQNALKRLAARVDEPIEELERELFSSSPEGKTRKLVQKRAPVRKHAPVQRRAPVQESAPPPVHETAPVPVQKPAPDPSVEPSIEPSTEAAAATNGESDSQELAAAAAAAEPAKEADSVELAGTKHPEPAAPTPPPAPTERPNAFALFEDNISPLTPILADELGALLDEHPASWVEDAIREAARSGGRNVKYVAAILSRWQAQGKDQGRNGGSHANTRRSDARADRPAQPRRERDPRRVRRHREAWNDYVARLAAQGLEPEPIRTRR